MNATPKFIVKALLVLGLVFNGVLLNIIVAPKLGWAKAPENSAMGAYLFMWGLFTLVMFIATLRLNRALQIVFGSLTVLFFLLAASDFTGSMIIKRIAGWEGIFCGFSAIYAALAQVLNEVYGRTVWPLGTIK